jgi:hypothetical protein
MLASPSVYQLHPNLTNRTLEVTRTVIKPLEARGPLAANKKGDELSFSGWGEEQGSDIPNWKRPKR